MANDTPDWKNLLQNDYVSSNSLVLIGTVTATINNLAAGGTSGYFEPLENVEVGIYDGIVAYVYSQVYSSPPYKPVNSVMITRLNTGQVNGQIITVASSDTYNANSSSWIGYLAQPEIANNAAIQLQNTGSTEIVFDTVTVFLYGIKAQISNPSSNPVQTLGVHGNNSVPGSVDLLASTTTLILGSTNQIVTRAIITPFNNQTSAYPAGSQIIGLINGAEGFAIPIGGLASHAFDSPTTLDFGEGISLGANGIQLNANIACQAIATLVLKQ